MPHKQTISVKEVLWAKLQQALCSQCYTNNFLEVQQLPKLRPPRMALAQSPPPPPAEEDVTALEAMGFPREAADERSGGNVERAAHRLLEDGAATRPPSAGAAGPPPLPVADVEPRASPATAVTTSHHHGGHTD
eukprot:CAMPEP_0194668718 /NCGR_PEP_ID=MMETSP0295-20121207/4151_1 /TAXON_ID=39354 /ORGANISM="Heterosigma akashiwo, Strain CCMP2393" /LENGTH=133 /DNA_ID=CAMNT_0039551559 /DNA_START=598 /DNA_END=1000 /DNA_ORIENTATION=+